MRIAETLIERLHREGKWDGQRQKERQQKGGFSWEHLILFHDCLRWARVYMHELPVTQSILNIALKHARAHHVERIVNISLRIGELSDLVNEWVQHYFDYLSKGTIAEGAKLDIERSPVVFRCDGCGKSFQVDMKKIKEVICPDCGGKKNTLISGREYYIKNIAVI